MTMPPIIGDRSRHDEQSHGVRRLSNGPTAGHSRPSKAGSGAVGRFVHAAARDPTDADRHTRDLGHILDRCRRTAAVEVTERHAAAASIICKPTYELYEAEITRMIAGGRPEGGIECS